MNAQIITQVKLNKYLVYRLAIFVLVGQIKTMFLFNRFIAACVCLITVCACAWIEIFILDYQNLALV